MEDQNTVIGAIPAEQKAINRRQLLTRLGVTGVVGAGLLISGEWRKPVVQAAYLPPHAQGSRVVYTIACGWEQFPSYTTFADITPPDPGISLSVEIFDSSTNASLETGSGTTDATGHVTYTTGVGCVPHPTVYAIWSITTQPPPNSCQTTDQILAC